MRLRHFILASLAALVTFVSCENEENPGLPTIKLDGDGTMAFEVAGGDQQITLTATRDWWVEEDAEWLDILPEEGKASADAQTITITAKANTGMDRTADVKFTIGTSFQTLTVTQAGPGGSAEDLIVYANDFDKELATQTYGTTGDRWPYLDQFDGWKNEKGTGIADVEYVAGGMSARNNANSNGSYSDYEGSGNNNLLFSTNNYFAVKNIALGGGRNYAVSFGTEKYAGDGDNTFVPTEFHVYISADASKWVELTYTFPGEFKNGRWDLASSAFTLPADVNTLHMYFKSDLTGGHRIDDLKLVVSEAAGTAVDFSAGVEIELGGSTGGGNTGEGQNPDETAIYHNNFDKETSSKTNDKWPYLDQFDGWKNETGTGASGVTYTFKSASARASSGNNNIWLPKTGGYLSVQGIALNGTADLTLSFSAICGSPGQYKKTFNSDVLKVYLSSDNTKWVELKYNVTTTDTEFESAIATFSVPANTASLSIAFEKVADETDGYRVDDVKLTASASAGTAVDFAAGVAKDFGKGSSDDGNTGGEDGTEVVVAKSIETGDYWIMTADKSEVVIPIDDQGKGYGYWNVEAASDGASTAENAFTFTWVDGKGYTIQDSEGRHHYMTTYNSFSISTSEQNDGSHYWAVTANADGTYSIVNTVSGKTVQMSSHGNFCPYTDVTGDLPTLVKADGSAGGEVTPPEGGDEGGNEGGEVTPPDGGDEDDNSAKIDIAGVIAAEDDSAVETEGLVVAKYERGILLKDDTGYLLVYDGSSAPAQVGDQVNVKGIKSTYANLAQIGTPTVTVLSSGNTVTHPAATVLDGTGMDNQLKDTAVEYIEYTGTLNVSGYYYNVNVTGASTAIGSLSYPDAEAYGLAALNGKEIKVTGYYIGVSGGKYVNTMITEVAATGNDEGAGDSGNEGGDTGSEDDGSGDETTPAEGNAVLTFPDGNQKAVNSYTDTWEVVAGGYTWTLTNFNNNQNGWSYVKCGRKADPSVASISVNVASKVSKVEVTVDKCLDESKVNSAKLIVAADADFANVVETISGSAAAGTQTFAVTTPATDLYYKLEYDCSAHGSKNGIVQISKVVCVVAE